VIALGEKILAELDDERTNDTLTRWLAHHIASLLHEADEASRLGAADAEVRASNARAAILELWEHRSAWPKGWPPPGVAQMVRLLADLPELDDPRWHRYSILTQLHYLHHHILAALVDLTTPRADDLEKAWFETFGDRLTADELSLLTVASRADERLERLFRWWDLTSEATRASGDTDEGGDPTKETGDTHPADPLAALATNYQQIILELLARSQDQGGDDPGTETDSTH